MTNQNLPQVLVGTAAYKVLGMKWCALFKEIWQRYGVLLTHMSAAILQVGSSVQKCTYAS